MTSAAATIEVYTDGENVPDAWRAIQAAWRRTWQHTYEGDLGGITFAEPRSLNDPAVIHRLPAASRESVDVRNPDLLFVAQPHAIQLGGIELTAHSPDGSNIEKRYPFAWVARRHGLSALVATPYQK